MNKTNQLAVVMPLTSAEKQREEALIYFTKLYGTTIGYIHTSDSFMYRGELFDYFQSGINTFWDTSSKELSGCYTLIDPSNIQNWLFTYGNSDERFTEYLERKYPPKNRKKDSKILNILRTLKSYLSYD